MVSSLAAMQEGQVEEGRGRVGVESFQEQLSSESRWEWHLALGRLFAHLAHLALGALTCGDSVI